MRGGQRLNADLLDSLSAHVSELMDPGNAADLIHLVQEHDTWEQTGHRIQR